MALRPALSRLLVASLVLTIFASPAAVAARKQLTGMSMPERHEQWMAQHGRVYRDAAEKQHRFEIFRANVELIEAFNAEGNHKYKLAANQFADLITSEYREVCSGYHPPLMTSVQGGKGFMYESAAAVPTSVDWRAEGAVTTVKHQGECGNCWAFSAVAAVEGITKLKTGRLVSLSEQELMDCDTSGENQGCNGGHMSKAFDFIAGNEGLSSDSNYPYKGKSDGGICNTNKMAAMSAIVTGYENVPANDEEALLKAVAHQPVSVAIDAGSFGMQFYSSGVFTGYCGTELNHGVAVVGYGTDYDGTKYWLVKNSWGTSWGEGGYMRMERDVTAKEGLCGIAMQASYPTA